MTATMEPKAPQSTVSGPRRPRRARRKPVRRTFIVTHRWLSLVLGMLLLVITVSGSVLLYRPELERAMAGSAYDASGRPATIGLTDAIGIVERAHPSFAATSVNAENGVYSVTDAETRWNVDPGTGEILGRVAETPGWIEWTDNLHECLLSCEGETGTIGALTKEVSGTGWLGYDGAEVTWGGLVLLAIAVLLIYLSLTGLWLWFPRPTRKAWRSSMSVRWKRGRFARDTDLHKVAGMVVLLPLLVWGVTGLSYESALAEKAWFAVTPNEPELPDAPPVEKSSAPLISPARAERLAQAAYPDAPVVSFTLPSKDDPTSAYSAYLAEGFDPYVRTEYPGDLGVQVDPHTGKVSTTFGQPGVPLTQDWWETANFPLHTGFVVNGWWRLIWLVLGLSPVLLAITGVSTWLVRRRTRVTRKKALAAGRAAPALPSDLAVEVAEDPETAPDLVEAAQLQTEHEK